MGTLLLVCAALLQETPLEAGNHWRRLDVDGRVRTYLVHVPKSYDRKRPVPVVLAYHGALMNAASMAFASGLNEKSEAAGFIVVYPNGTGPRPAVLFFNAGLFAGPLATALPDDVKFTAALLDDLSSVVAVDPKRVYATGLSNGGMMCYRLANELSGRIAAIAPVAGTLALDQYRPRQPVSVLHFHGTEDRLVPFDGPDANTQLFVRFKSVAETLRQCVQANDCDEEPVVTTLADATDDGTTVERRDYTPANGAGRRDVSLVVIQGGGHNWPGRDIPLTDVFLGRCTHDISANDMLWDFFEKHPLP